MALSRRSKHTRPRGSWLCIGWLALAGCASSTTQVATADKSEASAPAPESEPAAGAPATTSLTALREHVTYLADDAQQGRPPGTEADRRVQAYIAEVMKAGGLQPAFGDRYIQSFEITDGVRVAEGGNVGLTLGKTVVPHSLLPFSMATTGQDPVQAQLVFVGHGIATDGKGTGDYEGLEKKVAGKIVVAMAGVPDDPHLSAAHTRPQSRAIAARDHGAVGFVLWDPTSDAPFPNHGSVNDSRLPALGVGADGNAELVRAFTGKRDVTEVDLRKPPMRVGATSRKKASLQTEIEPVTLQTANVGGVLPGAEPGGAAVVVGAHMDHLGLGTSSSLAPGERAIHNGADDNASGVAAMLEVCRVLAERPASQRAWDVHCLAFGAEEMGLLGSKHYVAQLDDDDKDRIVAMINFDMVGRLRPEGLMVAGVGTSGVWPDLIEDKRGVLKVRPTEDGHGPSDHGSFYQAGIPVLHFFTGPHEDYHRPSDDLDKIDFEGMKKISDVALAVVAELLERQPEIDYKETKPATKVGPRSFKVSLGTIPDYAAQVDGVRLSGVRPGGPAEAAGLKAGDVITRIGEREIHNFDDFMATFGMLTPGDPVDVAVQRDGEAITLKMTPGAPRSR